MKFAPQGSEIRLSVTRERDEGEFWTRIDVADDGPGIPADRMESLFEPFRQGDGSTKRVVGGMGVGLALARKLAQAMGGRLTAISEVGKGSRFSLWLAAVDAD